MKATIDPVAAAIVEAATRAPSSHNTQPWHFCVDTGVIQIFADRTRALAVSDPEDRELTISCGCAILHLRVAAAGVGMASTVEILPDPKDPDLLATFRFQPGEDAPYAALDDYIETRRTYRKRFEPHQIPDDVLEGLAAIAVQEGAWFSVLSSETLRAQIAALTAEADAVLWSDPSWRRELAAWTHPRRTGDGLAVPWLLAPFNHAVIRSFDMGEGVGAKDKEIADESPVLAVLGTIGDGPADWLNAGQALARVLLEGCHHGLQASFLNQSVQVPALRSKLQHLLGRPGFPQIVLRMGYPIDPVSASSRRPLHDVLAALQTA